MNAIIKSLSVAGLLAVSSFSNAEGWSFGGGYANYSEDDAGFDINVGAIYATAGYTYQNGNLEFMPEVRLGVGVQDDSFMGVTLEVDTFFTASIRGQYNVTESFGVFLQPSYGRLEVTASGYGESFTDDTWEFGFGGGAAFRVSESAAIEAIYEDFDGSDVLSIAFRINL